MTDEQLQFAISQYVDGTLPADEVDVVEARLRSDPEAQRTLEEFRRINTLMAGAVPMPEVDSEQLLRQIGRAVDEVWEDPATAPPIPISRGQWLRPLALAASLLLVATVALLLWRGGGSTGEANRVTTIEVQVPTPNPTGRVVVAVLDRDMPQGAPVVEVSIGEGRLPWFPQAMESYRYVTATPSPRVVIAAAPVRSDDDADEDLLLLY